MVDIKFIKDLKYRSLSLGEGVGACLTADRGEANK
jgi:hypothetical protein